MQPVYFYATEPSGQSNKLYTIVIYSDTVGKIPVSSLLLL